MRVIDVVIVNYKSAAHTFKCVESVHAAARADGVEARIFVVNNGDGDAGLEAGVTKAGGAMVKHSAGNVGFGAAADAGARLGTAPFILFLNPDARLGVDALRTCLSFLENPANADFGIVGPELRDDAGTLVLSCSRLPSVIDLVLRTAGAHVLFPNSGYPFLPAAAHQASGDVGQVMGAALFVRRPLFETLGGFDPAYFLYYEDVDLCARAGARGARTYYLKEAKAVHIGRASSRQDMGMALALHVRSRLTYARKHFGLLAWLVLWVTCAVVEFPLRLFRSLLGGEGRPAAVLRAYKLLALQQGP